MAKTHTQIMDEAKVAAANVEKDLAAAVIFAETLKEKYKRKPLKIRVPRIGAILTGQIRILSDTRTWSPDDGYKVSRALGSTVDSSGRKLADHEQLPNKMIMQSGMPDIDYVWFVDWVRTVQLWWNFFGQFFGQQVPLLDRWGSLFYEVRGGPTLFIEMVDRPQATAKMINNYAETLQKADLAFQNLVARAQKSKGGG